MTSFTLTLRNRTGPDSQPQTVPFTPGQTLLAAATAAGVPLLSGCKVGACRTCAARVVRGTVQVPADHDLPADLVDAGVVLTCVTTASSDVVVDVGTPTAPLLAKAWLKPWTD